MRPRRVLAAATGALSLALVSVLTLSACSGSPAPTPSTSPASVAIVQGRTDYSRNVFAIEVTNGSDAPITVASARYASPSFATVASYENGAVPLSPGSTVDLRVPIPAVSCDGTARLGTVTVVLADGRRIQAVPTDPNAVVSRLVREGCIVHDVDAVMTVTPPAALRVDGVGAAAVAHIDLALDPTGADGRVTVTDVRSTTLMSPVDGAPNWPLGLDLDASSSPRTLTLDMRPTRCDPHALADDKVGTILVIDVSTSTGRDGRYLLPLPPAVKAQVYFYITAVCGD
ncbi:hypothetical protein E6C70_01685 [Glaciibacter flavus]|uniref:DUF4232 domain-containing protein n=1 Tax=Orlajensenia flava TaxID=2565934 RepID=A0A4S4FYV2_9MICO|nr:hypothetical protein [Glaciibacter flavus]THG36269.1 hypothetical protein E6C70_01685 [Glaciibacter flavus]